MKITLLPGDGIGPEIVTATVKVMDAAAKKFGFALEYDHQTIINCWAAVPLTPITIPIRK